MAGGLVVRVGWGRSFLIAATVGATLVTGGGAPVGIASAQSRVAGASLRLEQTPHALAEAKGSARKRKKALKIVKHIPSQLERLADGLAEGHAIFLELVQQGYIGVFNDPNDEVMTASRTADETAVLATRIVRELEAGGKRHSPWRSESVVVRTFMIGDLVEAVNQASEQAQILNGGCQHVLDNGGTDANRALAQRCVARSLVMEKTVQVLNHRIDQAFKLTSPRP